MDSSGGNKLEEQFSRMEQLLGKNAVELLHKKRVAIFGIGGVGGHVVEALVRCGVGAIDLIDHDVVTLSNLNRQLIAKRSTIGKAKVEVMKEHVLDINPELSVTIHKSFFLPEHASQFDFTNYDYVVDAVDTVTAKIALVESCEAYGIPIISSMGTGNKLDPTAFEVTDLYKTSVCPLAKVMRRELKKRNIKKLKVVYSKEEPIKPMILHEKELDARKQSPGSVAFVPAVAGLIIAGEVVKDLIKY